MSTSRRHRRCRLALLLASLLGLAAGGEAAGQTTTATIRGTVRDPAGAPVADAAIVATNTESGFQRGTRSQANGFYSLAGLQPGTYQLRVSSPLYQSEPQTLRVLIGQTLDVDLRAAPQAVALEGLTVTGNRGFETRTTEVATNVTREQIEALPQGERNFLNLAQLAPGIRLSTDEQRRTFASGGLPAENINVFIDGASYKNDVLQGGVAGQDASRGNPFPQNAIREFRVITENYKAEYQKASSAIITATTRSGGNRWEGGAFVYGQPNDFVEEDFFAIQRCNEARNAKPPRPCAPKPDYQRYQVGGNLGGPILRDRLHFFGSYEGNYQDRSNDVFLGGNAAGLPAERFQGFLGNFEQPFRSHLFFGKLTYQPATDQTVELSLNLRREDETRDFGGTRSYESAVDLRNDVSTAILKHDITFGDWLNQAIISFQRYQWRTDPLNPGLVGLEFQNILRVGGADTRQNFSQDRLSLRNDVTYTLAGFGGDHVIKAGANLDFLSYDVQKEFFGNPIFRFRRDLSLDFPFEASYGVGNPDLSADNTQFGIFLQDDWDIGERLTLNLGLRWDYESDMLNNDYVTPPAVRQVLAGVVPESYFTDGDDRDPFYGAIQPRIGASFDLLGNGATVLFGGFGVFYDRTFYNSILDEKFRLQYAVRTFRFSADGQPRDGLPTIQWRPEYLGAAGLDALIEQGTAPEPEVFLLNNDFRPPRSQQWSAGVRQALGDWQLSATYTGVRGYNQLTWIWGNRNVNPDDPTALPATGTCCRDVAGYGNVLVSDTRRTWYDALYLKADRPLSGDSRWGVSFAYTLAQAEQTGRDLFSLDKPRARDYERYPSPGDQRHTIVATGILRLPYQLRLSTLLNLGSGGAYTVVDASRGFGPNDITFRAAYPDQDSFLFPNTRAWAYRQMDFRLEKDFALTRGHRVGVVAELFNAFNFDNFGCFQDFLPPEGNPNLGRPQCTVNFPRRFQLGARYDF